MSESNCEHCYNRGQREMLEKVRVGFPGLNIENLSGNVAGLYAIIGAYFDKLEAEVSDA